MAAALFLAVVEWGWEHTLTAQVTEEEAGRVRVGEVEEGVGSRSGAASEEQRAVALAKALRETNRLPVELVGIGVGVGVGVMEVGWMIEVGWMRCRTAAEA